MSANAVGGRTRYVGMLAFAIVLVVFALVPATRPLALLGAWVLAPAIAFGTLAGVFRGRYELYSARAIVFALCCAVATVVTIPLGVLVVSETLGQVLVLSGLLFAVVSVSLARLTVTEAPPRDREIADPDWLEEVDRTIGADGSDDAGGTRAPGSGESGREDG